MDPRIKSFILKTFPKSFLKKFIPVHNALVRMKISGARNAFYSASDSSHLEWLGWDELDVLMQKYPKPVKYSYDPAVVNVRGRDRAREVLGVIPGEKKGLKSIELGALDAMASYHLSLHGFKPTAIDIRDSHFTEKVRSAGVDLQVMSATDLQFDENTYDLAFSYNAFEHIDDPEKALNEAMRVLKPGGYLYLNFGPLWSSSMGAHAHESIPVPFCQFLFTENLLTEYCNVNSLGTIEFHTMNRWPASRFKKLFHQYPDRLKTALYVERLDKYGLELSEKYPRCFRGKIDEFEDLIVSSIEALFQIR